MRAYRRTHLADPDLARLLAERVAQDFATTAALLADLAEFDARELYLPAAHPSLLSYCTEVLHLSKDSALQAHSGGARGPGVPMIFDAVAEGRLHLAGVLPAGASSHAAERGRAARGRRSTRARPRSSSCWPSGSRAQRCCRWCSRCHRAVPGGSGRREQETWVTGDRMRRGIRLASVRAEVTPLSGRSFELRFSIQDHTHDKLRRAQELLSPAVAPGDLASLFDRALDCLIARAERQKFAATDRPSRTPRPTRSRRHIPAEVKRAVRERDAGRCTFVSETGERCPASHGLQFDHIEPVARGGMATVANVRLLCAAHNGYEAERIFGKGFIDEKRDRARNGAVVRPPDDPAGAPSASIHIAHEPPAQAQACAEAARCSRSKSWT